MGLFPRLPRRFGRHVGIGAAVHDFHHLGAKAAADFLADRRLGTLCRREGIPLLTITSEFRAAAPHASSQLAAEWLYLKGYGHLNERGNAIAAQLLYKYLAEGDPRDAAHRPLLSQLR